MKLEEEAVRQGESYSRACQIMGEATSQQEMRKKEGPKLYPNHCWDKASCRETWHTKGMGEEKWAVHTATKKRGAVMYKKQSTKCR